MTSDTTLKALAAVAARDLARLRQVLRDGADPNAAAGNGMTALGQAVVQGDAEFVAVLVEHGADVNRACANGNAPLHLASAWSESRIAQFLLAHGADPDAPGADGMTPLCLAISRGQETLTGWLLEHGADVRRACRDGTTPLHLAMAADDTALARTLLERGADPEARDDADRTPVDVAVGAEAVLVGLSADVDPADLSALVAAQTSFAAALYGHCARGAGNVFFAPTSIATALTMTLAGARGDTMRELADVLRLPPFEATRLHAAAAALAATAERAPGVALAIANALFAQTGEVFRPDFVALLAERYRSQVHEVDFRQRERACAAINQWVATRTRGLIKELVQANQLNPLTRLVLLNAIFFKGTWAARFDADDTEEAPFFQLDGTSTPASLMFQCGPFNLAAIDGGQALELPYAGNSISMVVLLPAKRDGLPEMEQTLGSRLARWLDQLDEQTHHLPSGFELPEVAVHLPRFRIETWRDLTSTLADMGARLAFDPQRADFSGMYDGDPSLYLSAVRHRARVEVDEQGTTAAAVTAVELAARGEGPPPPPVFRADHPFIFLIRDRRTKAVLFLGRVVTVPPRG